MSVDRLPPGRHGLSPELVAETQRRRMLRAMAEATSESGYANVSVADVIRRAGVSRETFYEQFSNKEDCFLTAYDAIVAELFKELQEALPAPPGMAEEEPIDRFGRFVARYLVALEREPVLARAVLIETYAAGPKSIARRSEGQAWALDLMASLLEVQTERQRFACEAVLVASIGIVTRWVADGRTAELSELHDPLMEFARASLGAVGIGTGTRDLRDG